jgi:hypothetical protein
VINLISLKQKYQFFRVRGVAQVIDRLYSKCEALSSNTSTIKQQQQKSALLKISLEKMKR